MSTKRRSYLPLVLILILIIISCKYKNINREIILFPPVLSTNGDQLSFVTTRLGKNSKHLPNTNLLLLTLHDNKIVNLLRKMILSAPIWSKDNKTLFFPCLYEDSPSSSICSFEITQKTLKYISPYSLRSKYYFDLYPSISRTDKISYLRFFSIKHDNSELLENELWVNDNNNNYKKIATGIIAKARWTYNNKICFVRVADRCKKEGDLYIIDPLTGQEKKLLSNTNALSNVT